MLTSPTIARRTQPAATSQSTEGPATIATTVRSRAPRRASARQNSIGAPFISSPPTATVDPSATRAAASSMAISLLTGGETILPDGW